MKKLVKPFFMILLIQFKYEQLTRLMIMKPLLIQIECYMRVSANCLLTFEI